MPEEHRFRKRFFKIHLSDNEFQLLTDKAAYCNVSKTEYIRRLITDGAIINYQAFDLKKVCYEINRIGNNINQIAYQANASRVVSQTEFDMLKEEYENLLSLYIEQVMRG